MGEKCMLKANIEYGPTIPWSSRDKPVWFISIEDNSDEASEKIAATFERVKNYFESDSIVNWSIKYEHFDLGNAESPQVRLITAFMK